MTQWEEFLGSPAVFDLDLPGSVRNLQWYDILVDAPAGWYDTAPGRMKNIAAASKLARGEEEFGFHDFILVDEMQSSFAIYLPLFSQWKYQGIHLESTSPNGRVHCH